MHYIVVQSAMDFKVSDTARFCCNMLLQMTSKGNKTTLSPIALLLWILLAATAGSAQTHEKIIIDTDIGDDIDDAFAVALALRSPELEIVGVTTTFGDTDARAKIVDRLLGEAGREDIPVAAGAPTKTNNPMS